MTAVVATLDDYGLPAWIGVMILGFIVFWPIGLAILAYLIWSGRMSCGWHGGRSCWQSRFAEKYERTKDRFESEMRGFAMGAGSSGNKAFDEYRSETLKRLEDEEREFRQFLERLRKAKDKEQFEEFMADRRRQSGAGTGPGNDVAPQAT